MFNISLLCLLFAMHWGEEVRVGGREGEGRGKGGGREGESPFVPVMCAGTPRCGK